MPTVTPRMAAGGAHRPGSCRCCSTIPGQGQADAQLAQAPPAPGKQRWASCCPGPGCSPAYRPAGTRRTPPEPAPGWARGRQAVLQKPGQGPLPGRYINRAPTMPRAKNSHDGGAEDLPLLVLPSLGMGLAGELGDGQGQAGGGEGQQDIVNLIGGVEIRLAGGRPGCCSGGLCRRTR